MVLIWCPDVSQWPSNFPEQWGCTCKLTALASPVTTRPWGRKHSQLLWAQFQKQCPVRKNRSVCHRHWPAVGEFPAQSRIHKTGKSGLADGTSKWTTHTSAHATLKFCHILTELVNKHAHIAPLQSAPNHTQRTHQYCHSVSLPPTQHSLFSKQYFPQSRK